MENNERKNNRGIFYAVMGVATLVITIIGATFAYFVATTNSAVNAIRTGSTTVSLKFDDNTITAPSGAHKVTDASGAEQLFGIKSSLIPVDTVCTSQEQTAGTCTTVGTLNAFATGKYTDTIATNYRYAGAGEHDCRDANGNNICSVYSFTVTNPANVSQTIYPTFTVKTNGFGNLKYAVFKGTPAQVDASTKQWDVNGSVVTSTTTAFGAAATANGGVSFANTISSTAVRKQVIANPGDLVISAKDVGAASSTESWLASQIVGFTDEQKSAITADWGRLVQILDPNESLTYTMIFWIEETYTNQSGADMTKQFEASVAFTTEGNGTGVTGSLIMS